MNRLRESIESHPVIFKAAVVVATGSAALGLSGCNPKAGAESACPASYTVVKGDTLSEIAQRTKSSDETIKDQIVDIQTENGLNTDQIHTGQVLELPCE